MTPFILEGRKKLPPEPAPSANEQFDQVRQIWIDRKTGEPLVARLRSGKRASQYGETSITESGEGADQPERSIEASPYGKTSLTKTREGADMTEISSLDASSYGETSHTASREGADQPDRSVEASPYGETIETRTREGVDQAEISTEISVDQYLAESPASASNPAQLISQDLPHASHSHF